MPIQVNIQLTGNSPAEIRNDLKQFLQHMTAYEGEPINDAGDSGNHMPTTSPPRMTAAQKKAAEKAAEVAAKAAAAERAAAEVATDPETDKQDAADEAAETAATKPVDLTHDDVKKLLGGYVQAYGMAAAQEDGVGFIGAPKISEIPNTQAALAAAIIGIAQAIEKNPKKRDVSGDGLSAEKTAELKPIVAAALAVK